MDDTTALDAAHPFASLRSTADAPKALILAGGTSPGFSGVGGLLRFARRWGVARRGAGRPAHRADHRERAATAESSTRTGKQPATIERPIWRARLGNDLAPAAEFLAAKLASHTLLGALMGALARRNCRSACVPRCISDRSTDHRVQSCRVGRAGFRRIVIPPLSWMKVVRYGAHSQAALRIGPFRGATMAVFVLGTSPLFALLGYAARRAATAWRGRLPVLTGLA
jgi:hypothetical protein